MSPVHRIGVIFAAACALRLLDGCTSEPWHAGWQDGHVWRLADAPLPVVWASPLMKVKTYCGPGPAVACAQRWTEQHTCLIYTEVPEEGTPRWIADHERRHCAGWDHE